VTGHTLAWLIWTLGAAVPALIIRNPLYLAIIGLAAALVYAATGQGSDQAQSWRALLKIGALMGLIAIPLNALMVHQGRYVLFRLPLEAMAYGFVAGLAIWVLLLIFATFNVCVDASDLLRLAPPFLYQAGVVTSTSAWDAPRKARTSAVEVLALGRTMLECVAPGTRTGVAFGNSSRSMTSSGRMKGSLVPSR